MTLDPKWVNDSNYNPVNEALYRGWTNQGSVPLAGAPRNCARWTVQEQVDLMYIVAAGEWGWIYLSRAFGRLEDAMRIRIKDLLAMESEPWPPRPRPELARRAQEWLRARNHAVATSANYPDQGVVVRKMPASCYLKVCDYTIQDLILLSPLV